MQQENGAGPRRVSRGVGPRIACSTCGLRIPLQEVAALGELRALFCTRCHAVDTWAVGTARSAVKALEVLDDVCRAATQERRPPSSGASPDL